MKKMRFHCLALSAVLVLMLGSHALCEEQGSIQEFYRTTSLEVASQVDAFALSDCVKLYTSREEDQEQIEKYGNVGCHEPDHIYLLEFDRGAVFDRMLVNYDTQKVVMTDETRDCLLSRWGGAAVISIFVARQGTAPLFVSSVCNASKSYLAPDGWEDDAIVLLTKDGADVMIACAYKETGEGILTASASYMPAGDDMISSLEELLGTEAVEID